MRFCQLGCLLLAATMGTAAPGGAAKQHCCDDGTAVYNVLKGISSGWTFCSAFLYSTGGATKTCTSTVIQTSCRVTKTATKLIHETNTVVLGTAVTTRPIIHITEYTSTVIVPSGSMQPVNRRGNAPAYPTPSLLASCAPAVISLGCSSLVPPSTTTLRRTEITKVPCTTTVTQRVTTTDALVTSFYPVTVDPPADVTTASGVHTTTVPAACAGDTYDTGGYVGDGNGVFPQIYPNFPQTGIECCVLCWHTEDCIASAFLDEALECELLRHDNGTSPNVSNMCPKGVYDYPFGTSTDAGNIYPGPCGK